MRAPAGKKITDPRRQNKVKSLFADLAKSPQVEEAVDPFAGKTISEDGSTAYGSVS